MLLLEIKTNYGEHKGIPIIATKQPPKIKAGSAGSGQQAEVYGFRTRPNSVTKVAKLTGLDDPYLDFVATITQHQNNPFFPQIQSAKILEFYDEYWLAVQMEKLQPMSGDTQAAAVKALQTLGIDPRDMDPSVWGTDTQDGNLKQMFGNAKYRKELADNTKNPQFKEALQILEPAFQQFGSDMHDKNLMVRSSGKGSQIVLIDPFMPDLWKLRS